MLVIRDRQMARLDRFAEEEFITRLAAEIRESHGEQVEDFDQAELHEIVRTGVARARRHGLTYEDTIETFVSWMFEFAPNFDEQEHIKEMLADERLEPDERIDLIAEAATEEDWEQAEALYDEAAWELEVG